MLRQQRERGKRGPTSCTKKNKIERERLVREGRVREGRMGKDKVEGIPQS